MERRRIVERARASGATPRSRSVRGIPAASSENEPDAKLAPPGAVCGGDAAEGRRSEEGVGQIEVHMVEQVKGLEAKLQARLLAEIHVLQERQVHILIAGAFEEISRGVAEAAKCGRG